MLILRASRTGAQELADAEQRIKGAALAVDRLHFLKHAGQIAGQRAREEHLQSCHSNVDWTESYQTGLESSFMRLVHEKQTYL